MKDKYDEEEETANHSEETDIEIDINDIGIKKTDIDAEIDLDDIETESESDNDEKYLDEFIAEYDKNNALEDNEYDEDDEYDEDEEDGVSIIEYNFISDGTETSKAIQRVMKENSYHNEKDELEEEQDKEQDESEDAFFANISSSLKSQVHEELGIEDDENDVDINNNDDDMDENTKKPLRYRILKISGIVIGALLLLSAFLVFTKPGQGILIRIAAKVIRDGFQTPEEEDDDSLAEYTPPTEVPIPTDVVEVTPPLVVKAGEPRQEEYVINCLLFGIEEIDGARNTDSMMIASINTKTNEISLMSLMRDTYVDIPDYRGNKLNSVYEKKTSREEGAQLLIETIEKNFHIKIDAYASVNFDAMEKVVNMLGGVTIELTAGEAAYLRKNNYIADPRNRDVKTGVQTLNGGQVVGYCRVRYVATLGGANDDYGRTLRQRRVLTAIFDKYKSKGITDLVTIGLKCLNMVRSNITEDQIVQVLTKVIDNRITDIKSTRLPFEGGYYDSSVAGYNGIKYALVIDKEYTTKEIFKFIYGDTEEEATVNYELYKEVYAEQAE